MQTLSFEAVEDGAIVAVSASGERFRLPVDDALRTRLLAVGQAAPERRLSPREIQAHVRSGLSAEQVAALTGVPVASVERFVGPVLAERAYVVETALAVRLPPETEGARSRTFGAVMGERLDTLAAKDVRWSSAKEPGGWVLSVRFTADDVPHDARWRFDGKHMTLEPDNVEASTLSQPGVPAALTPRLRAIEPTAPVAIVTAQPAPRRAVDAVPEREAAAEPPERRPRRAPEPTAIDLLPAPRGRASGEVFAGRPSTTPDRRPTTRTREQRDAFGRADAARDAAAVTPLHSRHAERTPVEDRPTEPIRRRRERAQPTGEAPAPAPAPDEAGQRGRRGRTSMPSWDEIVFGRDER